jgi:peptidoglycan/LPS O-acetylase OafA/YrhL
MFALDVLRGVAVTLVLLRHMPIKPQAGEHVTDFFFELGWTGVDLFFVLSGFLISGLLFAEASRNGAIDFRRFWLRRGLKIWPAYYLAYGVFAIATLVGNHFLHKPMPRIGELSNLVFIQNYFPLDDRWPHSWSLAIEEHFYLLLPLLLIALLRLGQLRRLPIIAAGLCVAILVARCVAAATTDYTWEDFYYPTHFRADSLLVGVLVGYAHHYHPALLRRLARAWPLLVGAAVGALLLAYFVPLENGSAFPYTFGFTLLAIGFAGAVIVVAVHPDAGRRNPAARGLAWMGVYSYTIYLVHSVVWRFPGVDHAVTKLRAHTIDSAWVNRIGFWIASIVGGYVLSRLVERPVLALRAKWLPAPARD